MDAAFPRRAPAWPLLATLGVHLLLALSWRTARLPAPDTGGERVFELVPLAPPRPEAARLRPEPPRPRIVTDTAPRARTGATPASASREPEPITLPPEAPASVADPFAITAPTAPSESAPEGMVGRARRDAGAIDREMRKGKSGVPENADTPVERFRTALAGAYKDGSRGLTTDTYTAPDGQVIYRFRQGGKVWCRTSGSVRPQIGGAVGGGATLFDTGGGGGSAGLISCPGHGDWKRD